MRAQLLWSLDRYREVWATGFFHHAAYDRREEQATLTQFEDFVSRHERCFEKDFPVGHVTGSVFILNPAMDQVVLTLHGKLDKWLQLGGHCDGDPLVHRTAEREGLEESGLANLTFLSYEALIPGHEPKLPLPFDLDVHAIPARKATPEHWHFDARYLMIADEKSGSLCLSDESKDLRWVPLATVTRFTHERSMLRPFAKIAHLREKLKFRTQIESLAGEPEDFRAVLDALKSAES